MSNLVMPEGGIITPKGKVTSEMPLAIKSLEVIDPKNIECVEYRILLKVLPVETQTKNGLYLPEKSIVEALFNKTHAEIVAIGHEAFSDGAGNYTAARPKVGDMVVTAKHAGNVCRDEVGNLYRFANDKDVVAIIKEPK